MRCAAAGLVPPALIFWSSPACAQLTQPSDDGVSPWRVIGALALCLALALAGALALRARLGRGSALPRFALGNRRLRLEESLRINPQTELAIVSCDGREMLIATTPGGARVLRSLPAEEGA